MVFAYSRLYLGVHFPIDIIVGIIIGFTLAKTYYFLFKKLDNKFFA
ncbi:phosphatase PAP2 family protein [uncultured Polaribacter sp.]|nr:phosphatase PAP2 family protein [uncultured Polaribacter sp.]